MRRNPKTIWLCSNSLVLYFGIADSLILRFDIVSKLMESRSFKLPEISVSEQTLRDPHKFRAEKA
jgi:hypothetical protein